MAREQCLCQRCFKWAFSLSMLFKARVCIREFTVSNFLCHVQTAAATKVSHLLGGNIGLVDWSVTEVGGGFAYKWSPCLPTCIFWPSSASFSTLASLMNSSTSLSDWSAYVSLLCFSLNPPFFSKSPEVWLSFAGFPTLQCLCHQHLYHL